MIDPKYLFELYDNISVLRLADGQEVPAKTISCNSYEETEILGTKTYRIFTDSEIYTVKYSEVHKIHEL